MKMVPPQIEVGLIKVFKVLLW